MQAGELCMPTIRLHIVQLEMAYQAVADKEIILRNERRRNAQQEQSTEKDARRAVGAPAFSMTWSGI
jgi:hypothetical protein